MKTLLTFLAFTVSTALMAQNCTCSNMGPELVTNGDFSQGNTGFNTTYTFATNAWPECYGITTNASQVNPGSWDTCYDNTTGNGNFMWADASMNSFGMPIWSQTFNVNPNTNYVFSYWFENVNAFTFDPPGTIQLSVNNVLLGSPYTAPVASCQWVQNCVTWNSGSNTTATISIINQSAFFGGNDFGFDDISFRECLTTNCTITALANLPFTICAGQSDTLSASGGTSYSWIPSQGLSSNTVANPIASPLTTTNYMVIVSDGTCTDTAYTTVTVNPIPAVSVNQPAPVCIGSQVNLNASGGSGFSWSPATGLSNPNIPNPTASPTSIITYTVTVSDAGCSNSATVTLNVVAPPSPTGPNQTICPGQNVQLNVSGGSSFSWIPSTGLSDPGIANPIASPPVTTTYTVVASNGTCTATTTVTVNISDPPTAIIQASSTSGPAPLTVHFFDESLDAATTLFIVGNGDTTVAGDFHMTFNEPGTYTVYLIAWNGNGCPDTTSILIEVTPVSSIFVPNAFTPQADGVNDLFKAYSTGIVEFRAWLFDRWGNLMFTWHDQDAGWDGYYQGRLVQEDVYVWKIRALGVEGKHYNLVGHVSVIR